MSDSEQLIIKGNNASALLSNPILRDAFAAIRDDLQTKASSMKTTDKEACADLVRGMQVLDAIERCIRVHVETGKVARKELDMIAARSKPRLFMR